ncbi:MAG: Gx transporter family protein [Clostridia bacterium]|nr:Gx transporter family protein [Clostridia bacterium]
MNEIHAKKITAMAAFTALALVTFLIENLFPPLMGIPGAKMGLANIFSFAALIVYGPIEAFIVVALRTFLGALFAGNFSALLYSFTGGVISMAISCLLLYAVHPKISVLAVSVFSAVAHNVTQNAVYALITSTLNVFALLPYLCIMGVASGAIIGVCITVIVKKVPLSVFKRALYNS